MARLAELSLPGRVHVGAASEAVRCRLPIGVRPLDAVLNGGLPRGRISELIGPLSSGKTSLALTLLAAATRRGEVVACIDPAEALHPASLAIAGTDLQRLLWVRPPSATTAMRCAELLLQAGGFAVVMLDLGASPQRPLRGWVWPRLLHAAEQSHTALIVVAPERVAGSFAAVSLSLQRRTPLWRRGLWALFDGFETAITVVRNKLGAPGRSVVIRARESCPSTEGHLFTPTSTTSFASLFSPAPSIRRQEKAATRGDRSFLGSESIFRSSRVGAVSSRAVSRDISALAGKASTTHKHDSR